MRRRLFVLAPFGVAILAAIAVACSGGDDGATTTSGVPTPAPTATRGPVALDPIGPLTLGEVAQAHELRVAVEGYRLDSTGLLRDPREGMVFLVLTAHIVNGGSESVAFSRGLQFRLRAADGTPFRVTSGVYERGTVNVVLPPGGELRAEVAFEVPLDSGPHEVTFTQFFPTQVSSWTLPVEAAGALTSVPAIPEPPRVHEAGESVRIGETVVTVGGARTAEPGTANPLEGHSFIAVKLSLRNDGDQAFRWSVGQQVYAQDGYGYAYHTTSVAYASDDLIDKLEPGEETSGELAFDIPIDAEPLYVAFRATGSDDVAVWRVR